MKIKIGHLTYDIVNKPQEDMDGFYGQANHMSQTIKLVNNMSKERFREVLVHELLHCIMETTGLHPDNEEEIVNRLGMGLSNVLQEKTFKKLFYGESDV